MYLNNQTYDVMKWITQIVLPALGTLYFALAGIWGFPNAEAVVGTIVAVDTFLGILLGLSSSSYNNSDEKYDGKIEVEHDVENNRTLYSLALNSDPETLKDRNEVVFKVEPQ